MKILQLFRSVDVDPVRCQEFVRWVEANFTNPEDRELVDYVIWASKRTRAADASFGGIVAVMNKLQNHTAENLKIITDVFLFGVKYWKDDMKWWATRPWVPLWILHYMQMDDVFRDEENFMKHMKFLQRNEEEITFNDMKLKKFMELDMSPYNMDAMFWMNPLILMEINN